MRRRSPGVTGTIDAASLLLLRPGDGGPELLMVERAATLVFGGGAFAFPGGRVDPADRAQAGAFPACQAEEAALRIAALRECAEETGIDLRSALPDLASMTLFARWSPPPGDTPRRFDARFYLVAAPATVAPVPDGGEIVRAFWARPRDILARCDAGDGRVLFPTRRLLERLARFACYEEARDEALALPDDTIAVVRERRADGDWLCIPKDRGYPVTEQRLADASRS